MPEQPVALDVPQSTPALPRIDAVAELLASADKHFEIARHELSLGHLATAKAEFNKALEVLLESPTGAKNDARVREHFDRLVDRIAALELNALATGDGFTEHPYEPASIDELLAITTFDSTSPTAQTTSNVQADLEQTTHDIPIPLNERVLRYVELFQGRLREFLAAGLERGTQYLPMIQDVFRAEGLPLDLAYIPLIESAFKPTALSRAKAKGVWQFMRGTGVENGLKQDWYIDERSDPEKATVAAAKYLKTLYNIFDDWHLAMASYNGGPGRLTARRQAQRSRRLLDLDVDVPVPAARNARVRADDSRGGDHRQEPRANTASRSCRRRPREPAKRCRCRPPSTCGALPSGWASPRTRFRRSTPSFVAGRRRFADPATSWTCRPAPPRPCACVWPPPARTS